MLPTPPAVPPKAGTHGPQVALYDRCLKRWGKLHGFMAFIDTDEFIVLRDGTPNLPTLVRARAGLLQWDVCTAGLRLVALERRWRVWVASQVAAGAALEQRAHQHMACCHLIPPPLCRLPCPVQLKDYEGHGGLVVNWEVFGSGGLQLRPKGNPMMSYWRCSPRSHPGALRCAAWQAVAGCRGSSSKHGRVAACQPPLVG